MVRDGPILLDDGGEIPKFQGRDWRFDSQLGNLLSTWQKKHVSLCLSAKVRRNERLWQIIVIGDMSKQLLASKIHNSFNFTNKISEKFAVILTLIFLHKENLHHVLLLHIWCTYSRVIGYRLLFYKEMVKKSWFGQKLWFENCAMFLKDGEEKMMRNASTI